MPSILLILYRKTSVLLALSSLAKDGKSEKNIRCQGVSKRDIKRSHVYLVTLLTSDIAWVLFQGTKGNLAGWNPCLAMIVINLIPEIAGIILNDGIA